MTGGSRRGEPLTVMTRNVYLGADLDRVVDATLTEQGRPDHTERSVLVALSNAAHAARGIVDRTSFEVRAQLIAGELARERPDLVGLQEVALWRHGDLQPEGARAGTPNATTVDLDFLQILLDATRARGLRYQPVVVGERADVQGPAFAGSSPGPAAREVRLTVRDVILKRAGAGLRVLDRGDALYAHNLELTMAGRPMSFARGYAWVDVRRAGRRIRFVNTHLEAFSSDIAQAQAAELLAKATAGGRVTVLVGDFNSDPLEASVRAGDTLPVSAPYDLVTGNGFTDQWLQWRPATEGWTSSVREGVEDSSPTRFGRRLDFVFARRADGAPLRVERGSVTGTKPTDRDPATGLWPSDHGGVVLRFSGL